MLCHYAYSVRVSSARASNKSRSIAAALELLGTEGIRGLTHGRVDAQAGLPKGSTSNSFRTREALLAGVVEAMVVTNLPMTESAADPASHQELTDRLVDLFDFLVGPQRSATAARITLLAEATHDASLRGPLLAGGATMESALRSSLVTLGAREPDVGVRLLVACFRGLLLEVLAQQSEFEPRPVIERIVAAAVGD